MIATTLVKFKSHIHLFADCYLRSRYGFDTATLVAAGKSLLRFH